MRYGQAGFVTPKGTTNCVRNTTEKTYAIFFLVWVITIAIVSHECWGFDSVIGGVIFIFFSSGEIREL